MINRTFTAHVRVAQNADVNEPVEVTLSYDGGADPYAVKAAFVITLEEVRIWDFSRELLVNGAHSLIPYGHGDVKFRRFSDEDIVMMCMRSNEGHADVALPLEDVLAFLEDTEEPYAASQECDALLDDFLKELFEG
jgi:Streptomyces sporulation and cell division protein, SsgA.